MVMVKVAILDDLGSPVLEGAESFQLVLSMPSNTTLGTPHLTTITINDSLSDCRSHTHTPHTHTHTYTHTHTPHTHHTQHTHIHTHHTHTHTLHMHTHLHAHT